MERTKGWSKKGSRCQIIKNKGGYKKYHGIFIINDKKDVEYVIYDKPINRASFIQFIDNLKNKDILQKSIVMDNLRIHP